MLTLSSFVIHEVWASNKIWTWRPRHVLWVMIFLCTEWILIPTHLHQRKTLKELELPTSSNRLASVQKLIKNPSEKKQVIFWFLTCFSHIQNQPKKSSNIIHLCFFGPGIGGGHLHLPLFIYPALRPLSGLETWGLSMSSFWQGRQGVWKTLSRWKIREDLTTCMLKSFLFWNKHVQTFFSTFPSTYDA